MGNTGRTCSSGGRSGTTINDYGTGMLRIFFTGQDLARTTIAARPDPMWEVLLSLHALQSRIGQTVFPRWYRRTSAAVPPLVLNRLCEIAPAVGYSPDFLTPINGSETVEAGIEVLSSSPKRRIQADMAYLATRQRLSPWAQAIADGKKESITQLGDHIESYYTQALAPDWEVISREVSADRARRDEQVARRGVDYLLSHLHPQVRWKSPVLEILGVTDNDLHLEGRGIRLLPSYFCWETPTKLRDDELQPTLVLPVARTGSDPTPDVVTTTEPLVSLLGRTRSLVLAATISSSSTTGIARACDVSVASASRHTAALRESGLISSRRTGTTVHHEITSLGTELLREGTSVG